jgi:probable HAF family extracellular repeat protein
MSAISNAAPRAFRYRSGRLINLGTLPDYTRSWAFGINNQGVVIGYCDRDDERYRAFIHRDGRMIDLNTLIPADSGWVLETANDINDRGQIVGRGKHNGIRRAFLLTPTLPPDGCTIAQLCPCDNSWRSQAEYVRCVIQQAWRFFRAGLITADQRRAIIRDAILSDCGKRAAEPVCIHVLPLTPEECRRDGTQFVLTGDSIGACIIETSTDLVHWIPAQMDPIFIDGREVVCADPNPVPARFYRVRLDPLP